ncbi:MAG: hypothetical protein AAFO74_02250 [Pseudomonadota bacterium]
MTFEDDHLSELSEIQITWLRLLLDAFAVEKSIVTQETIFNRAKLSKDTLSRFRNVVDRKSKVALQKTALRIYRAIESLITEGKIAINAEIVPYISILQALYPDNEVLKTIDKVDLSMFQNRENLVGIDESVRKARLPVEFNSHKSSQLMSALSGAWLLLKPSNAGVSQDNGQTIDDPKQQISVGLLNVIPQEVDRHSRYGFFKLYQGSRSFRMTIEGVVDPNGDEAHFVGGRASNQSLFAMKAFYNIDGLGRDEHLSEFSGVMLGFDSEGRSIAAPLICFYLADASERYQIDGSVFNDLRNNILQTVSREQLWDRISPYIKTTLFDASDIDDRLSRFRRRILFSRNSF